MIIVPRLTDGVVTLRAHSEDDVDAIHEQATDPLMVRWTRVPVPHTPEDAKRFVREIMPGGWETDQEWGFAIEAEGRFGGTVSLRNNGPGRAEIAYGAHPWIRGRGFVERALRLLLEWGFAERDLETVIWKAQEGNWASRKLAWRVGFSCDGTLRHWLDERDGLVDAWVGVLTHEDGRSPRTPWLEAVRITGTDVVLRPHAEHDIDRALEACTDELTAYWLGGLPQPYTRTEAEQYVRLRPEDMAAGTAVHWAVADPVDDRLLGSVSIMDIGSHAGPEIGYWAHPDARGRGLMTQAVRLAVRHAFIDVEDGGLGLPKVRLVSAVDNTASRHVAEANGFREVGIERLGTICRDGRHDTVIYDLVPADLR
jgi:RimJ/RimL family protein N-acetyltransferase